MDATIHVDQQIPAASSVNWMPFGIAHDGPCNAAEYFTPTQEQGVHIETSSSRLIIVKSSFRLLYICQICRRGPITKQ